MNCKFASIELPVEKRFENAYEIYVEEQENEMSRDEYFGYLINLGLETDNITKEETERIKKYMKKGVQK